MIFGITNEERQNSKTEKCRALTTWHRWFAWRPVTLRDGRVAWLEDIERLGRITYTSTNTIINYCYREKEVLQRLDE